MSKLLDSDRYQDYVFEDGVFVGLFGFLEMSTGHNLLFEESWKDAWGNPWHHNSAFMPEGASMSDSDRLAAVDRWKGNLSDRDTALCEAISGELFEDFGYERSHATEDWPQMVKPLLGDEKLTRYLRRWLTESRGVEEFPTDPLVRENWEENATS